MKPYNNLTLNIMATVEKSKQNKFIYNIFSEILITRNIKIPISNINNNIKNILEQKLKKSLEGKCIVEGYVKKNSIEVIAYSNGIIENIYAEFCVVMKCLICCPVEGLKIRCVAKNITQAGIRAEIPNVKNEENYESPIIVFIARDHYYDKINFQKVQENDNIEVKIIGQRFELNDTYISVIAELVETAEDKRLRRINEAKKVKYEAKIEKMKTKKDKKEDELQKSDALPDDDVLPEDDDVLPDDDDVLLEDDDALPEGNDALAEDDDALLEDDVLPEDELVDDDLIDADELVDDIVDNDVEDDEIEDSELDEEEMDE